MQDGTAKPRKVVVIGAGVVGMGCASYLQRDGHDVTVIDRVAPGKSCSFGNGGGITTTSVLPLAIPGMMPTLVKWLFDPMGPLSVRWAYAPRLIPFLWRFWRNTKPERVRAITDALTTFMPPAYEAWEPLLEDAGLAHLVRHTGGLWLYRDDRELDRNWMPWQARQDRGLAIERIGANRIRQLEPAVSRRFNAGVIEPEWRYVRDPFEIVNGLAEHFKRRGGAILEEEVKGFEMSPAGPRAVHTDRGRRDFDAVVIAAGAWSHRLSAQLGSRVPLESQRGYHITLPNPGIEVRHIIMIGVARVAITPMTMGLRLVGAAEFPGVDAPPNYRQARMVLAWGKRALPDLNTEGYTEWAGDRPLLPDSMPVIGPSPHYENVFYAFAHSHMGLTTGAMTGKLIAELVGGRPTSIDLEPFRIDRRF